MLSTFMRRLRTFFTSGLLITAVSVTTTGGAAWAPPPTVAPRVTPPYVQGKVTQKVATNESILLGKVLSSIGTPYAPEGTSPEQGFSTSGFTRWAFQEAGVTLPASAQGQWFMGENVSADAVEPGTVAYSAGHVGVVVAPDMIVWASEEAGEVIASSFAHFSKETTRFAKVSLPPL